MFSSLSYKEDANFLSLSKMRTWTFPIFNTFQYDKISDNEIAAAIEDIENINLVNPLIDWEDDQFLTKNVRISDSIKHAYRVAAIALSIKEVDILSAISLNTAHSIRCGSCDVIDELCRLCKEDCPNESCLRMS